MKKLEETLLEQIKTIERQHKEIEQFKVRKPTNDGSPVETTTKTTSADSVEISIK